jgi:hypothetical protein
MADQLRKFLQLSVKINEICAMTPYTQLLARYLKFSLNLFFIGFEIVAEFYTVF